MDKTYSEVNELIKKGNELIASIPKKEKIAEKEKNLKEKYGNDPKKQQRIKLQLKYLKEEHDEKNTGINNNYSKWFENCNKFVNKLDNKSYESLIKKTKENLEIKEKINSLIQILNNINNNLEKENYIEILDNEDIFYKKIKDFINGRENNKVEFKSSLRWDWNTNSLNKNLEIAVNKTISAFLNSHGGYSSE